MGRRVLIAATARHGHFSVYAAHIAQWAWSRGLGVVLLGQDFAGTPAGAWMAQQGAVWEPCPPLELRAHCGAALVRAARAHRPEAAFLLHADELFFEGADLLEPGWGPPPMPLIALCTFGHRDFHLAHQEPYALRLRAALERDAPFAAVLTVDEAHAAHAGRTYPRLRLLPDMFREPQEVLTPAETSLDRASQDAALSGLLRFLDATSGPVVLAPGKLDGRKSPPWLASLALEAPDARLSLLGERVPGPWDRPLDRMLARLERQGRLHAHHGFLPTALLDAALAHPAVRAVALPYRRHFGSSGVQLAVSAAGKPVLAPDQGLLASRVLAHGLGATYAAGSRRDFSRAWRNLLDTPWRQDASAKRFLDLFTRERRIQALDAAFDLAHGAAPAPDRPAVPGNALPPSFAALEQGLYAAQAGHSGEALAHLTRAVDLRGPGSRPALMRRAVVRARLGDAQGATRDAARARAMGLGPELDFSVRLLCDLARMEAAPASFRPLPPVLAALSAPETRPGPDALTALGELHAQAGDHARAAGAFLQAYQAAPRDWDILLKLSDVLRYVRDFPAAHEALDRLAAGAPGWPGLAHKRGQIYCEQGLTDLARAHFLAEGPDSPHYGPARQWLARLDASGTPG